MPTEDVISPVELSWDERTFPIYSATPIPEGEAHPHRYDIDYLLYDIDPSTPDCPEVQHPRVKVDQAFDVHIAPTRESAFKIMKSIAEQMRAEKIVVFDSAPPETYSGPYVVISYNSEDAATTIEHNGKEAWVFDVSIYQDYFAKGLIRIFDWTESFAS